MIIGEVKTRLSAAKVRGFSERVDKLLKLRPEMTGKKLMKVMYAMFVQPAALEEARDKEVVLMTARVWFEEISSSRPRTKAHVKNPS